MLYIIGLGLADETDISAKGLEIVKKADRVYLEAYTAVLLVEQSQLVRSREVNFHKGSTTDTKFCSRSLTMAGLSSLQIVKWSNLNQMRFWPMLMSRMLHFS